MGGSLPRGGGFPTAFCHALTAPFQWIRTFVLLGRRGLRIAGYLFRAERLVGARVNLLYASGLGASLDLAGHAEQWARMLDEVAGELEVEPPARVTVLVVASASDFQYLFHLGQLYDLLTWRARALEAYQRALACEPTEAVQTAAREGIERPFVDGGES
jgi:hypothetical protein